mgnify:CR=1 FL=1
MSVDLNKKSVEQMTASARNAYPHECCGILIGVEGENGSVLIDSARAASNWVPDEKAGRHFKIDPMFLYGVEQEIEGSGREIVGFYHSHPDCRAVPSDEDAENMVPGLVYVILSVTKEGVGEIRSYRKKL